MRALATICLSLTLAACGGGFSTADEAVRQLITRTERGDADGARACLIADEQQTDVTFTLEPGTTYEIGYAYPEEQYRIVPVRFRHQGEEETMSFVCVDDGGYHVSLVTTLTRHMTQRVAAEVDQLGPNASPEELAEAMRRGMNAAPSGR